MTNTLHRFGTAESFKDDYIVFAIPTKVKKDPDAVPKLHKFLELALQFNPVNLGDARHGGAIRPSKHLGPLSHWARDNKPDFRKVIQGVDVATTCAAVFDNKENAERFVKRVKEEDLGLSVNVSTSIEGALECCEFADLPRHSVGYSLGFEGKTEKIPDADTASLSTMCGHGMISASLAKKMICYVKENRRTPEEASAVLARFCSCGIFNPSRAKRILEDARAGHQD
jgi:hypothetical protein